MSRDRAAIVGAGIAGLAAAEALSGTYDVVVYDRLPVPGGVLRFDHPAVTGLERRCRAAGVSWKLGTTAVRWDGSRLMGVGPGGICWDDAALLVYAGGCRPATLAELGVTGPRLAGVYPAPVAIHLAEAKVILGRRVAIIGSGHWARASREAISGHDCSVTVVTEPEPACGASAARFSGDRVLDGWRPVAVQGVGRVDALTLDRAGQRYRISCDAVILAGSQRPLRNVDGAVTEPAPMVAFVQPLGEHTTHADVAQQVREALPELIRQTSGRSEA